MSSVARKTDVAPTSPTLSGYLFVFIAVLFWGGSASLAKYLFTTRFDTLIITQTRSSLSFFLYLVYFGLFDRSVFRVRRRDLPAFALLGIIGIAGTNFTYYFTVRESTVATAIVVQYTAPVLVMLFAVAVSKEEEINGIKVLSLMLALAGCYLAVSGGLLSKIRLSGWALVSGPGSSLCYAFMLLATKKVLREYPIWTMLVYAFGFATLFWMIINPPWSVAAKGYTLNDWEVFWLFAIVSILIPHTTLSAGLKLLDASTAGIVSTLEPVVAIVVAYFAIGERLNGVQIFGAAAVVSAVILLQVRPARVPARVRGSSHAN